MVEGCHRPPWLSTRRGHGVGRKGKRGEQHMDGVVARGRLASYGLRVPTRVTATMPAAHELAAASATSALSVVLGVCLLVVLTRSRAQAAGPRRRILPGSAAHTAARSLAWKHSN